VRLAVRRGRAAIIMRWALCDGRRAGSATLGRASPRPCGPSRAGSNAAALLPNLEKLGSWCWYLVRGAVLVHTQFLAR